jgi:flagellin
VERLSSGLRINRAKDDAAGLGISEKIKSQVTSLNQGLRNANDAISMVQTAEGSLSEVSSILQRMKELSVQARNDSLSTTQRSFISDELVALKNEINSIAERTTFNDLSLLKNALRTQVAVPTAGDTTKLVNGTALLDGISVSNLKVNNTNAGTYTVTTGTQTAIANQISEAAGKFGGAEVDTITLTDAAGTDPVAGNVITVTAAINGGATVTASYTIHTDDERANGNGTGEVVGWSHALMRENVAKKVAAAFNVAAQAATGVPIAARAAGSVISIGGATDSVTLTTSASITTAAAGSLVAGTSVLQQSARTVTINVDDAVEGNKFTLRVGSKEYSVVAGHRVSAATIPAHIALDVATDLQNKVLADFPGGGAAAATALAAVGASFSTTAGNGLGIADMSLTVTRLTDGQTVTNQMSSVSAASPNVAATARVIRFNDFDIVAGRKVTVQIGTPEISSSYSTIIDSNDTAAKVAERLASQILANFAETTYAAGSTEITLSANRGLGMANIQISYNEMVEGAKVDASSTVSAKNHARNDRTITINQSDLTAGNVVSANIGQKEYAVKVESGETAASVAYRLSTLIDNDYGGVVTTPVISGGTAVAFNSSGMKKGDSITLNGLTFTAAKTLTQTEVTNAFAGLTANDTAGTAAGQKYGFYTGAFLVQTTSLTNSSTVTLNAGTAEAVSRRAVSVGAAGSSHVITLGAGLELGLEDVSVSVKKITDPGKITITANADTGIGGTKQSIDVGTIAANSAKSFDFDNLGVSFTLNNTRGSAVNAASFEAFTPKANTLAVQSAMNGEALFQVGAGTRDNVVLDGFKDIRITGQNKNAGSEKEVFDKINETLTTIAANTTESLSTANFATLENRIEDAITMVSDFRSYFGGQQNRIEFAISNIQAQSENLTAANSRIVDTDYAAETANLTKTQIMQQAATAMLAQANQMPNVILALLK